MGDWTRTMDNRTSWFFSNILSSPGLLFVRADYSRVSAVEKLGFSLPFLSLPPFLPPGEEEKEGGFISFFLSFPRASHLHMKNKPLLPFPSPLSLFFFTAGPLALEWVAASPPCHHC